MRRILLILVVLGLLFLGACGSESPSTYSHGPEKITTTQNVYQYLVEADGVVYRCFQTIRGGIWCTAKGRG